MYGRLFILYERPEISLYQTTVDHLSDVFALYTCIIRRGGHLLTQLYVFASSLW